MGDNYSAGGKCAAQPQFHPSAWGVPEVSVDGLSDGSGIGVRSVIVPFYRYAEARGRGHGRLIMGIMIICAWMALGLHQPVWAEGLAEDEDPSVELRESQDAFDILGSWLTEQGNAVVEITRCAEDDETVCGTIVRSWGRMRYTGAQILEGFRWTGEDWAEGRVIDPQTRKTYRGRLALDSHDVLAVKGCLLVFCRTQHWSRRHTMSSDLEGPRPRMP